MKYTWKIILIVTIFIAITVVSIGLFSYYKKTNKEGFQINPISQVTIATGTYNGTNTPASNNIPTTTNNFIIRVPITTVIQNFEYGLPVTVTGNNVNYQGILFAYNHPDVVILNKVTDTSTPPPYTCLLYTSDAADE